MRRQVLDPWCPRCLTLACAVALASVTVAGCQQLPQLTGPAQSFAASDVQQVTVQQVTVQQVPEQQPAVPPAPVPQQPVRLKGARGPLSAAQSKQVLDALRSKQAATDIIDRHVAIEEALTGEPLTTGNAVRLLQDGPATYAAMLAAMAGARDHINMETYIFDDDEVGQRFANALLAQRQQGVQVNLIHDSIGTLATPTAFFDRLREAGVQVLEFNPVNPLSAWLAGKGWLPNQRDHRKLLIVDGHTAFLGGINISSVYSGGSRTRLLRPKPAAPAGEQEIAADAPLAWRDTHLQLQGPVVAELQKLFLASWLQQSGSLPAPKNYFPPPQAVGKHLVRALASQPDQVDGSPIYSTLLSAIGISESSIAITNAYFVPDAQLVAALSNAAGRGVDVQIILPSQTDSWLVFHAGRSHYDTLLQAGVKIYERQGVVLHAKTALIDGVWSTVGSTNLDWRSFLHNSEVNAVVLGPEFAAQLQTVFDADLRASDPVLLAAWRQRPWQLRMKEFFSQLLSYWL
jgi:cardiolipin synthase A/B